MRMLVCSGESESTVRHSELFIDSLPDI